MLIKLASIFIILHFQFGLTSMQVASLTVILATTPVFDLKIK